MDSVLSEICEELKCSVCREQMYKPITLLCQHSLCKECAVALPKNSCPICNVSFVLPGEWNRNMDQIALLLNNEIYAKRKDAEKLKEFEKDERQKIKDKLYREIYASVVNRSVNNFKINTDEYDGIGIHNTYPIQVTSPEQKFVKKLLSWRGFAVPTMICTILVLLSFPIFYMCSLVYYNPMLNALLYLSSITSFSVLSLLLYIVIKGNKELKKYNYGTDMVQTF